MRLSRLNAHRASTIAASVTIAVAGVLALATSALADFGIEAGSFQTTALERDGTIDTRAGSHPYEYTVDFAFNQSSKGIVEGDARDVQVDLPPGLVGDPDSVPKCSRQEFEGTTAACPGDTQVGVVHATVEGVGEVIAPVFNMMPPPGVPARLGSAVVGFNAIEDVSVRTGSDYGVNVAANNIPVPQIVSISEKIWGYRPTKAIFRTAMHRQSRGRHLRLPQRSRPQALPDAPDLLCRTAHRDRERRFSCGAG